MKSKVRNTLYRPLTMKIQGGNVGAEQINKPQVAERDPVSACVLKTPFQHISRLLQNVGAFLYPRAAYLVLFTHV
jgi:hypothetical protein